ANLTDLAATLNKYADTEVLIEGHTDATGSDESNLTLSRNRAQSVANFLESLQVAPTRFTIMGYGEAQPIADNETESGRAANRRVELAIMANDKLKGVAKQKAGE
ncbi:OmpA family protein, partial [bacterium]|nr:OmpA family protein [bacterium]